MVCQEHSPGNATQNQAGKAGARAHLQAHTAGKQILVCQNVVCQQQCTRPHLITPRSAVHQGYMSF